MNAPRCQVSAAFSRGVQAWQKNEGGVEAEICSIYRMNCDKANAITKPCGGTHDELLASRIISTKLPSQRASRLVRRKFHSAYHIPMPLSDDSSRDDADKESEHSRRAARRLRTMNRVQFQTRNIANISIRRTYQPPPTSLYIQRTILMRQRDERRTRLSGVATAASAKPN